MRVIFVPVANRPECAAALNTAFTFGQSVGASVIGCHIRPHRNSPIALPSAQGLTNDEAHWQKAWAEKDSHAEEDSAKNLFATIAKHHGYDLIRKPRAKASAVWMQKTGSPQRVIGILGPMSDMLVVSRPAAKGGTVAQLFLSASLMKTSRPVLVLPQTQKHTRGKRICVAWNRSIEATQALAAALPLLVEAEQVSIVTCGTEQRACPKFGHLATYLKYWGIKPEHVSTPGKDESKEILSAYKSTNSDLLVMGAYSRNRISQLVFGGVTEYMLKRASIPVLMLHT